MASAAAAGSAAPGSRCSTRASSLPASAAVVIAARRPHARFDVAGVRVSIRAVGNVLIFVGSFAASARLLGWAAAAGCFPPSALPDRSRLRGRARALRDARRARHRRVVALCAPPTLLGSLVWIAAPPRRHPRRSRIPATRCSRPGASRGSRTSSSPIRAHLFDGNIFYPLPLTLTYSDATFLQGLLGAPFVLAGADPLLVANALTLLAFPACGLAFFYAALAPHRRSARRARRRAARRAGTRSTPSTTAISSCTGSCSCRSRSSPRCACSRRRAGRPGLRFGAAVAAQWLASMYVGVMLMSFLAPFLAVVALAWRVAPVVAAGRGARGRGRDRRCRRCSGSACRT